MCEQNYVPVVQSLWLSTLAAALPIFAVLYLLGLRRRPAWMAALAGLGTTVAVAAAGLRREDEARLFRAALRRSILLAVVIVALVAAYAQWGVAWTR